MKKPYIKIEPPIQNNMYWRLVEYRKTGWEFFGWVDPKTKKFEAFDTKLSSKELRRIADALDTFKP